MWPAKDYRVCSFLRQYPETHSHRRFQKTSGLTSNKFYKTGSAQGFETPLLYTGRPHSASAVSLRMPEIKAPAGIRGQRPAVGWCFFVACSHQASHSRINFSQTVSSSASHFDNFLENLMRRHIESLLALFLSAIVSSAQIASRLKQSIPDACGSPRLHAGRGSQTRVVEPGDRLFRTARPRQRSREVSNAWTDVDEQAVRDGDHQLTREPRAAGRVQTDSGPACRSTQTRPTRHTRSQSGRVDRHAAKQSC